MTPQQKAILLAKLAKLEALFYEESDKLSAMIEFNQPSINAGNIIIRNIQSIRKQINKL